MKALILAAGEGTRLRPLTLHKAKAMLPIGGKPLIGHIVELLRAHGVTEIAVNLHHCPEGIRAYLQDGKPFGVRIAYSHESKLMGTAGAAKLLESFLDETFCVYYGDVFTTADLTVMAQFHRERKALATVAVHRVPDPWAKGVVEWDEGTGRIARFVEKPPRGQEPSDLANAGIYVMEPEVLSTIPAGQFCDFGYDVFPALLAAGEGVLAWPVREYLVDIGSLEKYEQVQREYADIIAPQRPQSAQRGY